MLNRKSPLTPEILVETLKRSSIKTILIEGKEDLQIYRHIEEELDFLNIDFLACNGRSNLLEVYKVKHEIQTKLLFICDNDLWLFLPKPDFINTDLITTQGYSIENELYQDGIEIIDSLFSNEELERKRRIINNVCIWFAYEISLVLQNAQHDCKFSDVSILNHQIMELNSCELKEDFLNSRNFSTPETCLLQEIRDNYSVKLRGKFIFQVIEKIFQERDKGKVKYRKDQLFDLIYRTNTHSSAEDKILNRRKSEINNFFSEE